MSEYITAPPLSEKARSKPLTPMGITFGEIFQGQKEEALKTELEKTKKELQQAQKSGWSETAQDSIKAALATLQAYYQGKASKAQAQAALAQKQAQLSQEPGAQFQKYLPYIAIGGVGIVALVLLTRKK